MKTLRISGLLDKLVPVTTAEHVLWLRMEEWPPIWMVAVNVLNVTDSRQGLILQLGGWERC